MVSDLIEVMRDTNHLSTLKSRCTINNLLEYRCSEIEKIINNPSEFISHITSHHKTIQWHLDRLYRIRNEIAHSGIKQNFAIIRYTEHLYDYIASCVSEVVRIANDNNSIDFGEIIAVINDNYYEFEQMSTDINKSAGMLFCRSKLIAKTYCQNKPLPGFFSWSIFRPPFRSFD